MLKEEVIEKINTLTSGWRWTDHGVVRAPERRRKRYESLFSNSHELENNEDT